MMSTGRLPDRIFHTRRDQRKKEAYEIHWRSDLKDWWIFPGPRECAFSPENRLHWILKDQKKIPTKPIRLPGKEHWKKEAKKMWKKRDKRKYHRDGRQGLRRRREPIPLSRTHRPKLEIMSDNQWYDHDQRCGQFEYSKEKGRWALQAHQQLWKAWTGKRSWIRTSNQDDFF